MPIFEYQCGACGHQFDHLQRADEAAPRKCPNCGRLKLRKSTSAPNFHLRGTGWRSGAAKKRDTGVAKPRKIGHTLDGGTPHSHADDHSHGPKAHTHSHDGHPHSHGHRHKGDHKH